MSPSPKTTCESTQPLRFPSFPVNLRRCRNEADRSGPWVARKAGISKNYLWDLENDEKGEKAVSALLVYRLSRVFGCTMEELLGPPAA